MIYILSKYLQGCFTLQLDVFCLTQNKFKLKPDKNIPFFWKFGWVHEILQFV